MQPYFDPTRKTTSNKNGRLPQKNKMEDDLKKNKNGRRSGKKLEDDLNTNDKN
jgi:hypothetical protein